MNTATHFTMFSFAGLFALGLPLLFFLAFTLLLIIGMWMTFDKAGQPGWGCIIPIFNIYCLVKIAGKEWWWLLLYFIPLVNIVISILVLVGVARNFGKGVAFALGLIFLPVIFSPFSVLAMPLTPRQHLRWRAEAGPSAHGPGLTGNLVMGIPA